MVTLSTLVTIPILPNKLKNIYYLPIWTGIMHPFFKRSDEIVASSSAEAKI